MSNIAGPIAGLLSATPQKKAGFDINKLLGNPAFMSGMGLLSASRNKNIDPFQSALQGLIAGGTFKKQNQEQEAREKALSLLGSDPRVQSDPMLKGLLSSGDPAMQKVAMQSLLGTPQGSPSNVREWEYFSRLTPDQQKQFLTMKRATPVKDFGGYIGQVNPMTGGVNNVGTKTLAPHQTPEHAANIEASKVTAKAEAESVVNQPKAEMKKANILESADNVISTIDETLNEVDWNTAGITGAALSKLPGTDAYDFKQKALTIKANIGFDTLQAMREASPTGGALGQVAVQELNALQAARGSLDIGQSPEQIAANLKKVKEHYERWKALVSQTHDKEYGAPNSNFQGFEIID